MGRIPLLWLTISPNTSEDAQRLAKGLQQFAPQDGPLSVRTDTLTGDVVIGCASEWHLEVVIDRLKRSFDVNASLSRPHVMYREALTKSAEGEAKYAKSVDGRGQYGHVKLRLHPATHGTGCVFEDQIAGGQIPGQFVAAVEEGVRDALSRGVVAGYPIHDARIELYDGSYHDEDSTEAAFRTAGSLAVADAARKADTILLEPVMRLEVAVPTEYRDDVIANLRSRRGQVLPVESRGERSIIRALAPLAELFAYDSDLGYRTRGRGMYGMELEDFMPLQRTEDDDDRASSVRVPRRPSLPDGNSAIALPEPDDADLS